MTLTPFSFILGTRWVFYVMGMDAIYIDLSYCVCTRDEDAKAARTFIFTIKQKTARFELYPVPPKHVSNIISVYDRIAAVFATVKF